MERRAIGLGAQEKGLYEKNGQNISQKVRLTERKGQNGKGSFAREREGP